MSAGVRTSQEPMLQYSCARKMQSSKGQTKFSKKQTNKQKKMQFFKSLAFSENYLANFYLTSIRRQNSDVRYSFAHICNMFGLRPVSPEEFNLEDEISFFEAEIKYLII